MTRIDAPAWAPLAEKRKQVRDHVRHKFNREVGLKKNACVEDVSAAPKNQRLEVVKMLNLTRKSSILDADHKAIMTVMAKALAGSGLGLGQMGSVGSLQQDLQPFSTKDLRANWFQSPVFFDE